MKKYIIKPQKDGDGSILERDTDRLIFKNLSMSDARRKASMLNGGKGFRGWTPDFILKSIERLM